MEEEKMAAEPQESNGFAEESKVKSQESGGCAEESRVKSQESSEEDIIYDISENSENSEDSENAENDDNADNSDNAESLSEAEKKLQNMVAEMGAETVLEIIRDNRNAAIRQILAEVEAQRAPLQSGVSAARGCSSIFDLAALA